MRLFNFVRQMIWAATIAASVSQAMHAQVSNLDQQAWEAVNNKLIGKIQSVDANLLQTYAIQLTSTPVYAMWDQGDNGRWEFLNVADQVPKWGPTWLPSGRRFSQEYLKFATAVAIRTRTDVKAKDLDAKNNAYLALSKLRNAALRDLLDERDAYTKKQLTAKKTVMEYSDWVNNYSVNGPKWISLDAQLETAYTAWSNLLSPEEQSLGVFKKAMTTFQPDPEKDTVKREKRYPYNYAVASLGQIKIDGDKAWTDHTPVFTFNSSSDTKHRAEERTSWGASASYGSFFSILKAGANAQSEHYSLDISNQATSFTYAAYGFGFIAIEPGGWYSGALVSAYKDKTRAFLPQSPVAFETLWGPTGSLNLQPIGVIVAYRPQITAHMSSSMLKQVKDTLTIGGSVSWGPFSFGGNYTKTSETLDTHAEEGSITISSTSPFPYVIAVMSTRLNYVGQ
jgi:hypothetical protein